MVSRICEEFGITPRQALKEELTQVLAIMEMRRYANAKRLVERPDMDEAALIANGVSDETISFVMSNIALSAEVKRGE